MVIKDTIFAQTRNINDVHGCIVTRVMQGLTTRMDGLDEKNKRLSARITYLEAQGGFCRAVQQTKLFEDLGYP